MRPANASGKARHQHQRNAAGSVSRGIARVTWRNSKLTSTKSATHNSKMIHGRSGAVSFAFKVGGMVAPSASGSEATTSAASATAPRTPRAKRTRPAVPSSSPSAAPAADRLRSAPNGPTPIAAGNASNPASPTNSRPGSAANAQPARPHSAIPTASHVHLNLTSGGARGQWGGRKQARQLPQQKRAFQRAPEHYRLANQRPVCRWMIGPWQQRECNRRQQDARTRSQTVEATQRLRAWQTPKREPPLGQASKQQSQYQRKRKT